MAGQDFSGADKIDAPSFNRALWNGLKGNTSFPALTTGADFRTNRAQLLKETHASYSECEYP
jgi:hypothetical protein